MKKGQWFMNDETGVITNIYREAVSTSSAMDTRQILRIT